MQNYEWNDDDEKHDQNLHACEKIMPHGLRKASAGILTIIISEAPEIPFN